MHPQANKAAMFRQCVIFLVFVLVYCLSGMGRAAVLRVPSDYPTIQAAIDVCQEGDTVLVAPGLYTGEGNRDIELKGQSVTARGQGGPEACVIDCQGSEEEPHRGFLFYHGKTLGCIVLEIENSCFPELGEPDGIDVKEYPHNIIYQFRNIHVDPQFLDPNGDDYRLKSQAGRWDSVAETWVRDEVTSPCIDTGDHYSPIGREPFPNGGIVNMGAYGGTVEASKSYFNTEPCETVMAGDINGDCKVDFLDLRLMATHWLWNGDRDGGE